MCAAQKCLVPFAVDFDDSEGLQEPGDALDDTIRPAAQRLAGGCSRPPQGHLPHQAAEDIVPVGAQSDRPARWLVGDRKFVSTYGQLPLS